MSTPSEWITGPVRDEVWAEATIIREKRFAQFGMRGAFDGARKLTDRKNPQIGEVGEICLRNWLTKLGVAFTWLGGEEDRNPFDDPDFLIGGDTIDVKTRHRQPHYKVGTGHEFGVRRLYVDKWDWFFFCGYSEETKLMTFYGAISGPQASHRARIIQPGEAQWDGRPCITPDPSHEVAIGDMMGPHEWVNFMRKPITADRIVECFKGAQ